MEKELQRIAFSIENRTGDKHKTGVRLSVPVHSKYELLQDGQPVPLVQTKNWDYPWRADLSMSGATSKIEIVRTDRR